MLSILMIGQTDENGDLTIWKEVDEPMRLAGVKWIVGTLDSGVDAVINEIGNDEVELALDAEEGSLDNAILSITDADVDSWHDVSSIVHHRVQLVISSGGANKRGGAILYFLNDLDVPINVSGSVQVDTITIPADWYNGQVTLTNNTPQQLPSNALVDGWVELTAHPSNDTTALIFVGKSSAKAASGEGHVLSPDKTTRVRVRNTDQIWVNTNFTGAKVSWQGQ